MRFGARRANVASSQLPVPPHVPPDSRQSIVLVDDEKSYSELLTQMLAENLDCPVHAFSQPLDTLKALPALNPGVIVTDYFMPQLDGFTFIRRAAKLAPRAAFVLISGHNLTAHEDEMAALKQLKAYLPKPFGWRKLADEILRVWPNGLTTPSHRADATSL